MNPTNADKNIGVRTGTRTGSFRSSLIAAVIALVIYLAIYAITAGGLDIATGLVIAGITFVITFVTSAAVGAAMRRRTR